MISERATERGKGETEIEKKRERDGQRENASKEYISTIQSSQSKKKNETKAGMEKNQ